MGWWLSKKALLLGAGLVAGLGLLLYWASEGEVAECERQRAILNALKESLARNDKSAHQVVSEVMVALNGIMEEGLETRKEEFKGLRRARLDDLHEYCRVVAKGMVELSHYSQEHLAGLLSELGLPLPQFQTMCMQTGVSLDSLRKVRQGSIGMDNLKTVIRRKSELIALRGQEMLEAMAQVAPELPLEERLMLAPAIDLLCTDLQCAELGFEEEDFEHDLLTFIQVPEVGTLFQAYSGRLTGLTAQYNERAGLAQLFSMGEGSRSRSHSAGSVQLGQSLGSESGLSAEEQQEYNNLLYGQ